MAKQHPSRQHKHNPVRTCVVCRSREQKRALVRIVRTESGIMIDQTGKMNGRGAYLCDNPACWEKAASTNILGSALKTTLTEADRFRLQETIANHEPG